MEHSIEVKVYYEDTDSLGMVYHANYLKYFERGRTEMVERLGKPVRQWNEEGFNFVVYRMSITFKRPARLGDVCRVVTTPEEGGTDYRRKLHQRLIRDGEVITDAHVDLVCLDQQGELQEFPPDSV